jgi:hypothetical protein
MQLHEQQSSQNFTRERDAQANQWQRDRDIFIGKQAEDVYRRGRIDADSDYERNKIDTEIRDKERRRQELEMWGLNQGAAAMEAERRRVAEEQERQGRSIAGVEMIPVPGGGFVPVVKYKNGITSLAGGYMPAPKKNATPWEIEAMKKEAEKYGHILLQLPNGEWTMHKKDPELGTPAYEEGSRTIVAIPPGYEAPTGYTLLKPKGQGAAVVNPAAAAVQAALAKMKEKL